MVKRSYLLLLKEQYQQRICRRDLTYHEETEISTKLLLLDHDIRLRLQKGCASQVPNIITVSILQQPEQSAVIMDPTPKIKHYAWSFAKACCFWIFNFSRMPSCWMRACSCTSCSLWRRRPCSASVCSRHLLSRLFDSPKGDAPLPRRPVPVHKRRKLHHKEIYRTHF